MRVVGVKTGIRSSVQLLIRSYQLLSRIFLLLNWIMFYDA